MDVVTETGNVRSAVIIGHVRLTLDEAKALQKRLMDTFRTPDVGRLASALDACLASGIDEQQIEFGREQAELFMELFGGRHLAAHAWELRLYFASRALISRNE